MPLPIRSPDILVLRDRRPGHWRQAQGVADIAAEMTGGAVRHCPAVPRFLARNRLRRLALARGVDPRRMLTGLYGLDAAMVGRPDLVVAAGRPTAAAAILVRRMTGSPLIFVGALEDYPSAEIDLMLVGSPRQVSAGRVLVPTPTDVDPARLPSPRVLKDGAQFSGAVIRLMLGGDGPRGYRFGAADWRQLRDAVVAGATLGIVWKVASSRRTPRDVVAIFADLERSGDIAELATPESVGLDAMYAADAVIVTEDSLTMIAEAVASRRPVLALRPRRSARHGFGEEIVALSARGGLAILPIAELTPLRLVQAVSDIRLPAEDGRAAIRAALEPVMASIGAHGSPAGEHSSVSAAA